MNQHKKSLLLFAIPDLPASSANRIILGSLEQKDFSEANKSNIPV